MLLFVATLLIVIDVRMPDLDIVADAVGGVLVVIGALRINGAIAGADALRSADQRGEVDLMKPTAISGSGMSGGKQ